MNNKRFVLRSLIHHYRINLTVALGVAAATAVLTGALLIGDSMRGSLKSLTLGRLGLIDEILVTPHFFRQELVDELETSEAFQQELYQQATAAIIFPQGTLESSTQKSKTPNINVASNILVLGVNEQFWSFGQTQRKQSIQPAEDEIVLNQPLAEELQVTVGDTVTLRLPEDKQVDADSPLGNQDDRIRSIPRLTVSKIIPAKDLGRFSLSSSQQVSLNAYVNLSFLQDELDQEERANAILVSGGQIDIPPDKSASATLQASLKPTIDDLGLLITDVTLDWESENESDTNTVILKYHSLSSVKMMLDDETVRLANTALGEDAQPVLTYLANAIMKVPDSESPSVDGGIVTEKRDPDLYDEIVPYSMITAVDSKKELGPLLDTNNNPVLIKDDEVVINNWLAEDLGVALGDYIRIDYFEPETTHGQTVERWIDLKVVEIFGITKPRRPYSRRRKAVFNQPPTLLNDPDLTPEVPGVTDQNSINDWDLPFATVNRIRGQDDDYWNNHRTTPKAFVSLNLGRRLWGSRFGNHTTIRIPFSAQQSVAGKLQNAVSDSNQTLGMNFIPVKRNGLKAAAGSTPFDGLFLGLSLFVIASALMLIIVLFKLGIQQRASQLGVLLALGLRRKQISKLLIYESIAVSAIGGLLGIIIGIGYGKLMLTGLSTWWVDAIVTSFLTFHITFGSLIVGYLLGVFISAGTIAWAIHKTSKVTARRLLSGNTDQAVLTNEGTAKKRRVNIAASLFVFGMVLAVAAAAPDIGSSLGSEGQAGAFVGAGFLVLTALLLRIRSFLRGGWDADSIRRINMPLSWLASRNAGRNPGRSTLTIGLMAMASFLIIAMGAFKLTPSENGRGGFTYWGLSSMPVYENLAYRDLNTAVFEKEATAQLSTETILCLRYKPGDDASCSNVYQAAQPRVLGVPQTFVKHFDNAKTPFTWGANIASAEQAANPWHILDSSGEVHDGTEANPVPVVIDKNTAMYSLKLYGGMRQVFDVTYEDGHTVHFKVVGLLANSILQGSLLISEQDFKQLFPHISGYRYFLATDQQTEGTVRSILENRFRDQGLDMQSTQSLLEELLAVQNTYISAFQSLGALGLLLGTFGLATVQLRSILERRGELALMKATGFSPGRLAQMVLCENIVLLCTGLVTGVLAALFAVLPHIIFAAASPPGVDLFVMLLMILVVGVVSGLFAVRATLRAPLIPALRGE
ncbi:MAG: ABC transporter permease [Planctomycetaceae bacterium]|nr:ABC transporter permease [Planctomycetaceae bacterium]